MANFAAASVVLLLVLCAGCDRPEPVAAASPQLPPSPLTVAPATAIAHVPAGAEGGPVAGTPLTEAVADSLTGTTAGSSGDATSSGEKSPILSAVRVGEHPGIDRLVFEFDGAGVPAWRVEYVAQPPSDCGSGDGVVVAGASWLQIRFTGAQAHTEAGAATSGPRRRQVNQSVLREIVRTCDFEGELTWVAGVAHARPYTTQVLAGPSRLVIDIEH